MERIGCAGFLNNVVGAVNGVVPWAAVPMVVAGEVEDTGAGDVEGDVLVVVELIKEMAGVRAFVAACAVVGAPHVGAHADALQGPVLPLAIGVEAYWDCWRFNC